MTFNLRRFIGRTAFIALLGGLPVLTPIASAGATTVELEEIPTWLVVPSEPLGYPDPICLGCKIVTKKVATSSPTEEDETAVLSVTYLDDANPTFVGSIVLTVALAGTNEVRVVTLDGVLLTDGQITELLAIADPDWTWAEVDRVLVELHEQ